MPGNVLKVGGFLNQQIDISFMKEIGKEIKRLYEDSGVTKIFTIEASGIAIAVAAGFYMDVPVVFAKKNKSSNVGEEAYTAVVESYTHGTVNTIVVAKEFLNKSDRILVVDDFLANGNALNGLIDIINQSGATTVGAAIAVEKAFQKGGDKLRERGVRVESLAIVEEMTDDSVIFRPQDN